MAAAAGVKVTSRFNMILNAGKATPQPPVGSALGQRGLNLMNFCKAFNDETAKFKDTVPIRVRVTAYADRTFTFQTQGPSSTYLLLKAAGIEKGAHKPGYETVGRLSVKHIYEIAKVKHQFDPGLSHVSLYSVCTQLVGSCKSLGIEVYAPERTS